MQKHQEHPPFSLLPHANIEQPIDCLIKAVSEGIYSKLSIQSYPIYCGLLVSPEALTQSSSRSSV